jgi:hypothetical protein
MTLSETLFGALLFIVVSLLVAVGLLAIQDIHVTLRNNTFSNDKNDLIDNSGVLHNVLLRIYKPLKKRSDLQYFAKTILDFHIDDEIIRAQEDKYVSARKILNIRDKYKSGNDTKNYLEITNKKNLEYAYYQIQAFFLEPFVHATNINDEKRVLEILRLVLQPLAMNFVTDEEIEQTTQRIRELEFNNSFEQQKKLYESTVLNKLQEENETPEHLVIPILKPNSRVKVKQHNQERTS